MFSGCLIANAQLARRFLVAHAVTKLLQYLHFTRRKWGGRNTQRLFLCGFAKLVKYSATSWLDLLN